ncbi:MAG TPA: DUF58 domain-containing protein [Terriglobia bacterium]|nr:DUF58 domain-containing protein [Terriglobia bacterium]
MPSTSHSAPGSLWHSAWTEARYRIAHPDWPAWRRFFLALFALALSFFLAVYSGVLNFSGRHGLGVLCAALSLVIVGVVAVKVVPYLARRTALERWMVKIEFEFTREGAVYLLIIAVIVVAALNTGNNLLFIILASLLAGILVSGILSHLVLSDLDLEFALPEHIFAGKPLLSRLTLRNLKWLMPSFSVTVTAQDKGTKKKAGNKPGVARNILNEPVYIPYIPRRGSVTQHVELNFPRRGRYTQEGFRVSTKFPFGFLRKTREVPARHEILVLPDVQPTEEFYEILPLVSGEVESLFKGRGHDLYAIRDYQESDSARHVDWKATAKALALKVREFTREDERRLVLVFDSRISADNDKTLERFEKAVAFCACLAWHFYEIDAQMQFLSEGYESLMAPAHEIVYPALESLALIEPKVGLDPNRLLSQISSAERGFHIILTSQPRGSVPTSLWGTSYLVFISEL